MKIDVCLVAGRRPDLLQATLNSFRSHLFCNFDISRVIANIDPVFGTEQDQQNCVDLIRSIAPDAIINLPEKSSFCSAVKYNWSKTVADVIFHLEDDWRLNKSVHPKDIEAFDSNPRIGQICFNHDNKNWPIARKGRFSYRRRHINLFGIRTPFRGRRPVFTTSPAFLRGSFAREAASLMDVAFDPEKQFFNGVNLPLERYVSGHANMVIGEAPDYYNSDLGREWRELRGIQKLNVDLQSVWLQG